MISLYKNRHTNRADVMRKDLFFREEGELKRMQERLKQRPHRTFHNLFHIYDVSVRERN